MEVGGFPTVADEREVVVRWRGIFISSHSITNDPGHLSHVPGSAHNSTLNVLVREAE